VEGDLDLHGFFGFSDTRPGFTDVRWTVELGGPAGRERLLTTSSQQSDEHCPVLDLFRNPTHPTTLV